MFDWFKKKLTPEEPKIQAPEVLGLRLGGAVELDDLRLKLIEPDLIIEGAARTQLIQAVGVVNLDEQTRLLRYYTDDDGFIQVLQHGRSDADVSEVKLYYFYHTKPIDTQAQWNDALNHHIVQDSKELEGHHFDKVWENERPVAMTEKTYLSDGTSSETDQFVMIYERELGNDQFESMMIAGEEKFVKDRAEWCVVTSTGFPLTPTDFTVIG
ncbi:hypothetical protein A3K86_17770 [Photobacterium jeanii]|uniref:DUF2491 domain-containing protein n=1 Tax=Photobacterium jeanii TaxID=858640 RepID=A0A178K2B7_9GAMM|nr:YjfK family protein [Photobacterium jeanii]OAN10842.1 hypothetical protein A3K86_17770 [Photobacterium jeanii]PST90358.1 DUF2491 domain-containing protein [Photobacterium jeanii]